MKIIQAPPADKSLRELRLPTLGSRDKGRQAPAAGGPSPDSGDIVSLSDGVPFRLPGGDPDGTVLLRRTDSRPTSRFLLKELFE